MDSTIPNVPNIDCARFSFRLLPSSLRCCSFVFYKKRIYFYFIFPLKKSKKKKKKKKKNFLEIPFSMAALVRAMAMATSSSAQSMTSSGARGLTSLAWTPSNDVGIVAMDVYFPNRFVSQEDLEKFDGVAPGKYTKGLEQSALAFTDDREDICSMSLTALRNLLDKYRIDPKDVGRLEVGTETVIDKSKSVKSVLMQLFEESGNSDVEGIDTINACYGGTAALLNAINWVESSSWDGRYAVVVTGDIAVYEKGPARPTCGAAVVAMLVGPNAPIAIERRLRATHMEHAYDFYKPNLHSEYPVVDGHASIGCYLRALDSCYGRFSDRFQALANQHWDLQQADYCLFHSPFTKMARKSFQRMYYLDYLAAVKRGDTKGFPAELANFSGLTAEQSFNDPSLSKALAAATQQLYTDKVEPSLLLPKEVGNSYTASLYTGLLSLIANRSDAELNDQRLVMFSYGSGLAATQFSLKVRSSVDHIRQASDLKNRLASRIQCSAEEFNEALTLREETHSLSDYKPRSHTTVFPEGAYYLAQVDSLKRRVYERK